MFVALVGRWKVRARSNRFPRRHLAQALRAASRAAGDHVESLESRCLLSASVAHTNFVLTHGSITKDASTSIQGYTAAQVRKAYGIDSVSFNGITGDGTGQTIALIDAYDAPDIQSDLKAFDAAMGLTDPTLTVVKQNSSVTTDPAGPGDSWALETSLDVEWTHAVAPKANILLVEAASSSDANLDASINIARTTSGVSVISMSYGGAESSSSSSEDTYYTTPTGHTGITFVASSGDNGAYTSTSVKGVEAPAVSKNVVGVGGTSLTLSSSGAYSAEAGWGNSTTSYKNGGSGGGISKYVAKPTYQSTISVSSTYRTVPDVSFLADPNTGVAIYDSYDSASAPWIQIGGTSLASPMFAGVIAIVDQGRIANGLSTLDGPSQTLPMLYSLSSSDFHDVTTGNNGYAAGVGYDLVTGLGTPIVNKFALDMAGYSSTATTTPTVSTFTASPTSTTVGASVLLTATASDTGGTISTVKFYADTDGTTGLNTSTDTLLGTGTGTGTYTLTASTAALSAKTYTLYAVATDSGSVTANKTATLTLTNPVFPPSVTSFTVNPTSTTVGASVVLTAAASETNGTISSVKFYADTDGTAGLNTATDTLLGTGTGTGTYTLTASTAALSATTYTLYAVATDSTAVTASKTATLTLTAPVIAPVISSFTVNPTSTTIGSTVLLSAVASESGGSISTVKFYADTDGTTGLSTSTDTLLGTGSGTGTFTLSASTASFSQGTYTLYAVATDASSQTVQASTSLTLTAPVVAGSPVVSSFSVNPTSTTIGSTVLLSAAASETNGTISIVKFYADTDGTTGLNTSTDKLLGTATGSGTFTLSTGTSSFSAGTTTLYAVATDASAATAQASTTLTLTSPVYTPTITSFSITPSSTTIGSTLVLSAAASETSGTISSLKFYRESNSTTGLQTSGDTLIGTGTLSNGVWTISSSTSGLSAGTYTYYAVATDASAVSTAASSATETLSAATTVAPTTGTLLGWEVSGQSNYGTQGLVASTIAVGDTDSLGLTRGGGITGTSGGASKAWGGAGWASTSAAGLSASKYVTFGLTVKSGYTESITSIDLHYRRSSTGPANGLWQYQLNSGAWVTISDTANLFSSSSTSGAAMATVNLSAITALQNLSAGTVINFRLAPYGATATAGTWYVYNQTGTDLTVTGKYAAASTATKSATRTHYASIFSTMDITPGDTKFWE